MSKEREFDLQDRFIESAVRIIKRERITRKNLPTRLQRYARLREQA